MTASVAFLRAVNVGGRTLRPTALAEDVGLVNIGAAGTFVGAMEPETLRDAIQQALPFATEIMVCRGEALTELVRSQPFGTDEPAEGVKRVMIRTQRPVTSS